MHATIRVAAFNLLLDQPDAIERFRRIERSANKAGRLFALAAWQLLDRKAYDRLSSKLRDDTSMIVEEESGCTPRARVCGELVQDIEEYSTGTAYRAARADAFFYYMEPLPPPAHRTSGKDPTLPRQALELGVGGRAEITASLRADGTVEAVESSGQWLMLNDEAARAVRSWRFDPIPGFPKLRVFATFDFTPETRRQHWSISYRYVSGVVHSRGDTR
jgi:TonB family protein